MLLAYLILVVAALALSLVGLTIVGALLVAFALSLPRIARVLPPFERA